MASIPYMPLYVADYLSDTAHLTNEEMGMYSRLIALYWQRGSAIPADDKRLCTMLGIPYERSTDVLRTIKDFFIENDGLLYHKRIESELAKFREKSDKAKAAVNTRYKAKAATNVPTNVPTDVVRTNYHTDTDTDTDTDNKNIPDSAVASPTQKASKHKHGEYKNVLLTDSELEKLQGEYNGKTDGIIQHFSELKAMKGYTYKSDYLAIKKWGADAYLEKNKQPETTDERVARQLREIGL